MSMLTLPFSVLNLSALFQSKSELRTHNLCRDPAIGNGKLMIRWRRFVVKVGRAIIGNHLNTIVMWHNGRVIIGQGVLDIRLVGEGGMVVCCCVTDRR